MRILFVLGAIVAGCHHEPRAAPLVPPARTVCAPVQGPTKASSTGSSDEVASFDGAARLGLETSPDGATLVQLKDGRAPLTEKMPAAAYNPSVVFRGPNVLGFGRSVSLAMGGDGYVAWTTLKPRALFVRRVHDVQRLGASILFNDKCKMHILDLATGALRDGAVRACSWFRVRGDGVVVAHENVSHDMLTSVDFPGPRLDIDTGKPLPGSDCEARVGGVCLTLGTRREIPDDDPPGPESEPKTTIPFEVRAPNGTQVRGEADVPHYTLSHDHVVLWRDAAATAFALVGARVEGTIGAQLVLIDQSRVSVRPLTEEQRADQRRIPELRDFVPAKTNPEDVDALIRERRKALADSANDRVRLMDYPACTTTR